jgi:hypothetical protein
VFQTALSERIVNDIDSTFHEPALIGIFDTKDEITAVFFGDQICV